MMGAMRLLQHKREAWWFYRFLSVAYDRVNPLFWTEEMRAESLVLAELDAQPGLRVLDVGAGTGFTTEGIVGHVDGERVTMLDQSPHQLARSRARAALRDCRRELGDAEALPFGNGEFDRWISAGSVEYWPDPQRAVDEAFRVLRPGGVALLVGPLRPAGRVARALAELWMLFPPEEDYRSWFAAAGFRDVRAVRAAPAWVGDGAGGYALAIAGRRPADGRPPPPRPVVEPPDERLDLRRRGLLAARFVVGSLAGVVWIPVALALGWWRRR
jgi:MPBQ/MSBQ methyltransferase